MTTTRVMARLTSLLMVALMVTSCTPASAPPTTITVTLSSSAPDSPERIEVPLGSEVTMVVTSEIDDVLHVHGYELTEDVHAGDTTELNFTADLSGVYEVETHEPSTVWIKLVVK